MDDLLLGFIIGVAFSSISLVIITWNCYHVKKDSTGYNLLKKHGFLPAYKIWFKGGIK